MAKTGGSVLDKYNQVLKSTQVIPAANGTGSTQKIPTNYNPRDKSGMLIARIVYNFDATLMNLDAILDQFIVGVAVKDMGASGILPASVGIIDYSKFGPQYGTLVGFTGQSAKVVSDFSTLIGGGILIHPSSVYFFGQNDSGAAWAAAVNCFISVYYSIIPLTPDDWQEMWQIGYISNTI